MGTGHDGPAVTTIDDRYELGELVGVGGMGEVWAARDRRLGRPVVVKLLRERLADDPTVRRRFETEARSAARLGHPNVVAVFDTGEHEGRPYIVMERLPGPTLAEELRGGPLEIDAALAVAADVLAGLAAAHAAGIVHRDVKPANVIRSDRGTWKVADFGIAKAAGAEETAPGSVVYGTPTYLAPEVLGGRATTPAGDVYSAGVLLYEVLTGAPPAPPGPAGDPRERSLAEMRPDVAPAVAGAVDRARSADPSARFADAGEMGVALGVSATRVVPVAGGEATVVASPTERLDLPPPPVAASGRGRRPANAVLAVAVALFVALVLAGAVIGGGGSDGDPPQAPLETVVDSPTVPPPTDEAEPGDDEKDDDEEVDDDDGGGRKGKKGRD